MTKKEFDIIGYKLLMANLLGGSGADTGLESYLGENSHSGPRTITHTVDTSVDLYASGANHFRNSATGYNGWSPSGGDSKIDYALGRILKNDIEKNEIIKWDDLE